MPGHVPRSTATVGRSGNRRACRAGRAGHAYRGSGEDFGVTKGSFYWHFKDRQDLFTAVLKPGATAASATSTSRPSPLPGREHEQLLHLIDVYGATRNRKGISIELAVREWARRDAQAAAVVEEVDTWRLECTRKLFVARGVADDEAKSRSLLLYAYVFGQSLMACESYDPAESPNSSAGSPN
jgi:AcrR family transcriptional regulator